MLLLPATRRYLASKLHTQSGLTHTSHFVNRLLGVIRQRGRSIGKSDRGHKEFEFALRAWKVMVKGNLWKSYHKTTLSSLIVS